MKAEKRDLWDYLRLVLWGEKEFLQPWLANFWLMIAFVIWYHILGFGVTKPSDEVIQATKHRLFVAKAFNENALNERLGEAGNPEVAIEEAKRLANWKSNFPWTPTTDPAVPFEPDRYILRRSKTPFPKHPLSQADHDIAKQNVALRRFFQNEVRFSKQFEQTYHVFADYGRTNNPVYLEYVFYSLRDYHQAAQHADSLPHEIAMRPSIIFSYSTPPNREVRTMRIGWWQPYRPNPDTGKTMTWSERTQYLRERLLETIHRSQWLSPDYECYRNQEDQSRTIHRRLIAEVENMTDIPDPQLFLRGPSPEEWTLKTTYWRLMESEHPDFTKDVFVPFVGWADKIRRYEEQQLRNGNSNISIWESPK